MYIMFWGSTLYGGGTSVCDSIFILEFSCSRRQAFCYGDAIFFFGGGGNGRNVRAHFRA